MLQLDQLLAVSSFGPTDLLLVRSGGKDKHGTVQQLREAVSGYPFTDVVSNTAKLALTGLYAGDSVRVTGEKGRFEKYLGDLGGNAGVTLSGAGTAAVNGSYYHNGSINGKPQYAKVGGSPTQDRIYYGGAEWLFVSGGIGMYQGFDTDAYPWIRGVMDTLSGAEPFPVVARGNPIAAEDNWLIEGPNTYQLLVSNEKGAALTFNGINVPALSSAVIGWVKDGEMVPLYLPSDPVSVEIGLFVDGPKANSGILKASISKMLGPSTGVFLIPAIAPPRATLSGTAYVTITFF